MTYTSRSEAIIEGVTAGAQAGVEATSTKEHCSLAHAHLSYAAQALDGIAHSVGPLTPISNQENASQIWPQANPMEISSAEVLSSQSCQAGNKGLLRQKVSTGLATLATMAE